MSDLLPAVIPAYAIANPSDALFAEMFEDAMGGLSLGRNPQIKVKQGKWKLVDRDGNETTIKPTELVDGEFLPVVVLRAKRALSKTYYIKGYDPAQEATAPDCASDDAVAPNADIKPPMAKSCALCPMNAYGSGRNANGQPTEGKACSDTKILAVFYKGGIYELKVNPSSLRNLAGYFAKLQERRVSPGAVVTYVGLDDSVEFTKMTFKAGKFLNEQQIPQLIEKATSAEAEAIISPRRSANPKTATPAPAPAAAQAAPAKMETVDDILGEDPTPEPAPKKKAEPKSKATLAAVPDITEAEVVPAGGPSEADLDDILNL